MLFKIFLPYQSTAPESVDLSDYYKSGEDYAAALRAEDAQNGAMIFNTMSNGGIQNDTYYGGFGKKDRKDVNVEDNIEFTHSDATLYTPDGATMEDVDSIIDKFAAQEEFLITMNFNEGSMDAEFEEELANWNDETRNILKYAQKMGEEWLDTNIPRREMRLSFKNKSGKELNFKMEKCEIQEKISRNRYLIYVNRLNILK